ncbi:N-acetyltransferase [Pseudonocardiaceae bacterium YIM PH 21723]|nr:N-acetyltransferase [Pseudonocardiaceae bacterium YIM PH 21723]
MEIYLKTERLTLRELTAEDLPLLTELHTDPEVMRYLESVMPTEDEVRVHLRNMIAYYALGQQTGYWAALDERGRFLGWFLLRPDKDEPRPGQLEVGYRLHRFAWGQGYGTEGTRALVDKAFAELGADEVFAGTMAANLGSRRVMEKSGLTFRRVGHGDWMRDLEGGDQGGVRYAIDRAAWSIGRNG